MANQKHLDLQARNMIEQALNEGQSFKAIGRSLDKDCTTISKEVRNRRVFQKKGVYGRAFNDCVNRIGCPMTKICPTCSRSRNFSCSFCGKCTALCDAYVKEICPKLDKAPYVCNSCVERNKCTLEKALYKALASQKEYELLRSESRSGLNLTEEELAQIEKVVSPLLMKGQSIHHICSNHPDELMRCEKSLYTYIDAGLLSARNIDLPRRVRMKPRKGSAPELKVDKKCRIGRTYEDFEIFQRENPDLPVVELDSVVGIKGGAVLLTIHFVTPQFQIAIKREANNSQSVIDIFERFYWELGPETYRKLFPLLLADNGSEFSNPSAIEFDKEGNRRSHLFYCDPNASFQKGACENNHEFIRRIIPKGTDIGKYTNGQIRLMMSHINSYGRAALGDKSPREMFEFVYGRKTLDYFNIQEIPRDDIVLKPSLLQ